MRLPTKAIVIIAILVIVLVAVVVMFFNIGGTRMSETQARQIFTSKCIDICNGLQESNDKLQFLIKVAENEKEFILACQKLYGNTEPNVCLNYCSQSCAVKETVQEQLCYISENSLGSFEENCEKKESLAYYKDAGATCDKCVS